MKRQILASTLNHLSSRLLRFSWSLTELRRDDKLWRLAARLLISLASVSSLQSEIFPLAAKSQHHTNAMAKRVRDNSYWETEICWVMWKQREKKQRSVRPAVNQRWRTTETWSSGMDVTAFCVWECVSVHTSFREAVFWHALYYVTSLLLSRFISSQQTKMYDGPVALIIVKPENLPRFLLFTFCNDGLNPSILSVTFFTS